MHIDNKKILISVLILMLVLVFGVQASTFIPNVTANATSYYDPGMGYERHYSAVVNGKGVDVVTGIHSTTAVDMWMADLADSSPAIWFDLGKSYHVESIRFWNYNEITAAGIKSCEILYSISSPPGTWISLGNYTLSRASGVATSFAEEKLVNLGGAKARMFKIVVKESYTDQVYPLDPGDTTWAGLSEIRFISSDLQECLQRPEMDLNNNCKVDLGDLNMLASTWLDCGLEPQGACFQ